MKRESHVRRSCNLVQAKRLRHYTTNVGIAILKVFKESMITLVREQKYGLAEVSFQENRRQINGHVFCWCSLNICSLSTSLRNDVRATRQALTQVRVAGATLVACSPTSFDSIQRKDTLSGRKVTIIRQFEISRRHEVDMTVITG